MPMPWNHGHPRLPAKRASKKHGHWTLYTFTCIHVYFAKTLAKKTLADASFSFRQRYFLQQKDLWDKSHVYTYCHVVIYISLNSQEEHNSPAAYLEKSTCKRGSTGEEPAAIPLSLGCGHTVMLRTLHQTNTWNQLKSKNRNLHDNNQMFHEQNGSQWPPCIMNHKHYYILSSSNPYYAILCACLVCPDHQSWMKSTVYAGHLWWCQHTRAVQESGVRRGHGVVLSPTVHTTKALYKMEPIWTHNYPYLSGRFETLPTSASSSILFWNIGYYCDLLCVSHVKSTTHKCDVTLSSTGAATPMFDYSSAKQQDLGGVDLCMQEQTVALLAK